MRFFFAFIVVTGGLTGNLVAQEGLSAGENQLYENLSLAQVLEAALAYHPSLRIAEARQDAATSRATEVRSALYPQLKLTGRAAYLSDVPEFTVPFISQPLFPSINNSYAARVSLQQPLFTGFKLGSSVDIAEANAAASEFESKRDRSDFVLHVTSAYWNLYRAERLEDVLVQSVEQVSAHLRDVRNVRDQGMATEADVLKVETQLSDINVRLIQVRGNRKLAEMTVNSLMGRPLAASVRASDDPLADSTRESSDNLDAVVRAARGKRPEVAALRQRKAMQEAAVTAAQGGWYPSVVLSANVDYARPNPRVIPPKDEWETTWDVGLNLQWNIWDWFSTAAQSDQARAQLSQAGAALDQLNDAVALEAAQSYFAVKEARERITASRLGSRQAEESHRITSEKFSQGLASSTDLLDAEMALLQARLTETQAYAEYAIQNEKLRRALGELP